MLIPFGVLSAAGGGVVGGTYDLIESVVLGSDTSSVTFSSLATYASTYKHLQVRAVTRDTTAVTGGVGMRLQINGVTSTSYAWHRLLGDGSTVSSGAGVSQDKILIGISGGGTSVSNSFGATVLDVLDAYSGAKNTTTRALTGVVAASPELFLGSGLFNSTASITSLTVLANTNFVAGSRFSLYGIRG